MLKPRDAALLSGLVLALCQAIRPTEEGYNQPAATVDEAHKLWSNNYERGE
jgi:hypothetical protein